VGIDDRQKLFGGSGLPSGAVPVDPVAHTSGEGSFRVLG